MKLIDEKMKNVKNSVTIAGKLLDVKFGAGKTSTGKDYERATATVRAVNNFGGHEEVNEIPVSFFATRLTNNGTPNNGFKTIQELKNYKTVENYGLAEADTIAFTGAQLQENIYKAQSGTVYVNNWQIRGSFIGKSNQEMASFETEIVIMDMSDELRDDEPTGRYIITGGILEYGPTLHVLKYVVEDPDKIEYIQRNWNINDTVIVKGSIRRTVIEREAAKSDDGWGDDMPTIARPIIVNELIIRGGSQSGMDEDYSFDVAEVKKLNAVRKSKIEQLRMEAAPAKKAEPAAKAATLGWD